MAFVNWSRTRNIIHAANGREVHLAGVHNANLTNIVMTLMKSLSIWAVLAWVSLHAQST